MDFQDGPKCHSTCKMVDLWHFEPSTDYLWPLEVLECIFMVCDDFGVLDDLTYDQFFPQAGRFVPSYELSKPSFEKLLGYNESSFKKPSDFF